jgi:hypothetical protein
VSFSVHTPTRTPTRRHSECWYLDARGTNTGLWPDFTFRFRQQTKTFDVGAYDTARAVAGCDHHHGN